jgi:hypothetical protein
MALNEPTAIPPSLAKSSVSIARRLKFYPQADRQLIYDVRCGIVFIMAFWSGPSFKVYPAFVNAVLRGDPDGMLEVIVVDTDGIEDWHVFPDVLDNLGGWGEVVAIHSGKVIRTSGLGYHPETFSEIVSSLVDTCRFVEMSK